VIWGTWHDPNFLFNAVDAQGHVHEYFCYAASDVDLRTRLEKKGLTVKSIAPYDFTVWKDRARRAKRRAIGQRVKDRWTHFRTQAAAQWPWLTTALLAEIGGDVGKLTKAIVAHEGVLPADAESAIDAWFATLKEEQPQPGQSLPKTPIAFSETIWRELKWHLFDLFHGKCAYCEVKPTGAYSGDVEHFRPKGKVDEDPDHPGYYWLAYEVSNLLPSCAYCNQYHNSKLTHFPVEGKHGREPDSVQAEQPLLLNPYNRAIDPFQHLEFNEHGITSSRNASKLGETSRRIYYLDRPGLAELRLAKMQLVELQWKVRFFERTIVDAFWLEWDRIHTGEDEYSAAQIWALERHWEKQVGSRIVSREGRVPVSLNISLEGTAARGGS
jgi:hypothetical protein